MSDSIWAPGIWRGDDGTWRHAHSLNGGNPVWLPGKNCLKCPEAKSKDVLVISKVDQSRRTISVSYGKKEPVERKPDKRKRAKR